MKLSQVTLILILVPSNSTLQLCSRIRSSPVTKICMFFVRLEVSYPNLDDKFLLGIFHANDTGKLYN